MASPGNWRGRLGQTWATSGTTRIGRPTPKAVRGGVGGLSASLIHPATSVLSRSPRLRSGSIGTSLFVIRSRQRGDVFDQESVIDAVTVLLGNQSSKPSLDISHSPRRITYL